MSSADEAQILSEIEFIQGRTQWLKRQPRQNGALVRLDDRLEAGLLIKLIEEREDLLGQLS